MADHIRHSASGTRASYNGSRTSSASNLPRPSTTSARSKTRPSEDTLSARRPSHQLGAKPVAPSWHPRAPQELRVKEPAQAVLLPQLSLQSPIAAKATLENAQAESPISPTDPQQIKADEVLESEAVKLQRPSIKVRIITWNQGNSVPKGDLGVLLGKVGEYIAPEQDWDVSSDEGESEAEAGPSGTSAASATNATASQQQQQQEQRKRRRSKVRGMGVAGQEHIPRHDRIPPLPHDDAHPYHVIVVAGQECPWGDGKRFSTGVGLAGELGDLGRSKSRAAFLAKEREKKEAGHDKKKRDEHSKDEAEIKEDDKAYDTKNGASQDKGKDEKEQVRQKPSRPTIDTGSQGFPFHDNPKSAIPTTPAPVTANPSKGSKGWSDMCEDWFCRGPLAQATATKGIALATTSASKMVTTVSPPGDGLSTPMLSRPTTPLPNLATPGNGASGVESHTSSPPKRVMLAVPKLMTRSISKQRLESTEPRRQPSPLDDDDERNVSESAVSTPGRQMDALATPVVERGSFADLRHTNSLDSAKKQHHHRLALRIPGLSGSHQVTVQSDGTPLSLGAYELVIKERCYMMYTAVYVWRGCLDRVRGISHGTVKSGLLSGRVGNKGAVGISLQLGQTRLLFVNAHLAAHEGRVAERIANIEKIKRELKVDTFLPPDDPRNEEHDLTASFDYAFWFGDLNFRVDISRKHADWLMLKKQYDHALAFDQLRKIMKEQPTVLQSFAEAPITFPPTFKYDVLKTLKAKKRDVKARRARSEELAQALVDMPTSLVNLTLANRGEISAANSDDEDEDDTSSISSHGHAAASSTGNTSDNDGNSSFNFSLPSSSPVKSQHGTASTPDVVASNTAAAEGMNLHGKAIRARKRLFKIFTHAVDTVAPKPHGHENSLLSASSSFASNGTSPMAAGSMHASRSNDSAISLMGNRLRSHTTSNHSVRHSPPDNTNDSALMYGSERRGSVATSTCSTEHDSGASNLASVDGGDANNDVEQQPFDTSAKQRVPSWCDRVLWRSNVPVEEDEVIEEEAEVTNIPRTRFGIALSNAINRFHAKTEHIAHHTAGHRATTRGTAAEHRPTRTLTYDEKPVPGHPQRRRMPRRRQRETTNNIHRSQTMLEGAESEQAVSQAKKPFRTLSTYNMPVDPVVTSDSSFSVYKASQDSAPADLMSRARMPSSPRVAPRRLSFTLDDGNKPATDTAAKDPANRQSIPAINAPQLTTVLERPKRHKPQRSASAILQLDGKRASSTTHEDTTPVHFPIGAQANQQRRQSSPIRNEKKEPGMGAAAHTGANTNGATSTSAQSPRASQTPSADLSGRVSWWADRLGLTNLTPFVPSTLSNALRTNNNATASEEVEPLTQINAQEVLPSPTALIGPKRGVVECLLYKSLNDREMRLLEGRSDHRPVIFVGSIGIGGHHPKPARQ